MLLRLVYRFGGDELAGGSTRELPKNLNLDLVCVSSELLHETLDPNLVRVLRGPGVNLASFPPLLVLVEALVKPARVLGGVSKADPHRPFGGHGPIHLP